MEGYNNGHADDGHIYAEAKPREKGPFVGTMITGIGGFIGEEQWSEEWAREE